jgi:hypothetical protein
MLYPVCGLAREGLLVEYGWLPAVDFNLFMTFLLRYTSAGMIMPVYLSFQTPVVIRFFSSFDLCLFPQQV